MLHELILATDANGPNINLPNTWKLGVGLEVEVWVSQL